MRKYLLLMLLFAAFSFNVKAQSGSIDDSFNPEVTGASSTVRTTAIQSNGKIIIGGYFTSYNGTAINRIARLNTYGTLDTTFNPGAGANGSVYTTAIQSDGKIIIGGDFTSFNGTAINRIARLNTDGTLDTTFNIGTGANNIVRTITIQSDGKIMIGGQFTSYNDTTINRIARLNADGTLDTTFNTGTGVSNNTVATTAIQSDGKIIIGGYFTSYNGTARNNIARLNADGTLDTTFNPGTGTSSYVFSIAMQSDGKIIIGGSFSSYNGTLRNRIARLNADGTLDTTFNQGNSETDDIYTTAIQSDGKIMIGGFFTSFNGIDRDRIARLNADGTLDTTFNPGAGANSSVETIAIQSDGKTIIGGGFSTYNGTARGKIARLNADGTLYGTFDLGTGANGTVHTTIIQTDGKIIIGGEFTSYNGTAISKIARLNADGTLDTYFNTGTGANGTVNTAAIQSDGKIIIGGEFTSYNGIARNHIARLNTDGTLDGTFDQGTGASDYVNTTAIQSDGKIIIGGGFLYYNGTAINRIARLNADGTIDGTFDPGTGASGNVNTTAIQSDGKIIIGGSFAFYNGTARSKIARLNADGTLDVTFDPGTGANNIVWSTAIQSDGKIIIGGSFSSYNETARNRIARLNADGTLDGTFDLGTGASSYVLTINTQSDGDIIIGGNFTTYNGTTINRIARLNADGTLDTSFDPGTGANDNVFTTAIQSDGKIIIVGSYLSYNGTTRNYIVRLLNCINTFSSITETACDSYTAPDGIVYTTSGIKTAVIPNAAGCDSTITIDLTVNNSTTSSIAETTCDSYTAPDGTVYTTSGIKTAVIPNAAGCDSTITIDLTVNNSTTSSITETACYSYTAPDGTVYTTSGIKTAVIPNAAGCDSTITINLTVNNSTTSSITETACDSYTAPDGTVYTTSGIKTAVIPNAAGCDSTITINLTVNNSTTSSITETACDSYTAPDGTVYTTSGIKTAVIPNAAGCDSTITIDLTINIVDVSLTVNEPLITANANGAIYQWLDCDNAFAIIPGATSQNYTAQANGNYAVMITQGLCTDTSECVQITNIGIANIYTNGIFIYPNPVTNVLNIEITGNNEKTDLVIINSIGQVIFKDNFFEKTTVQTSNFAPGVYLIRFENGKMVDFKKIIKE
ncbi:MAG: hypothetical protein A2X15_00340 [Bacteroidetes bacterium GWB2_32_14]|nr:MAG: hypothetical protein A2X15_00340 [Bacteroidetes bacterium GWB2_32_14]